MGEKGTPEKCERCGYPKMERLLSKRISYRGDTPDRQRKAEEYVEDVERIMEEPIEPSEMRAGMDMLKEREKELGYEPGRLTGKRERPHQKGSEEKVSQPDRKKLQKEIRAAEKEATVVREEPNEVLPS